jgi:hypothetical protein
VLPPTFDRKESREACIPKSSAGEHASVATPSSSIPVVKKAVDERESEAFVTPRNRSGLITKIDRFF